jgi:hypothetical protein
MTLQQMIEQLRANLAPKLTERTDLRSKKDAVRSACVTENRAPSEAEAADVVTWDNRINEIDAEVERVQVEITGLEAELRTDEAMDRLSREVHPTGTRGPAYDQVARTGAEPRTYSPENDAKGVQFLQDVARQFTFNDAGAVQRLSRHMQEESVERGQNFFDRSVSTASFAGLVVPQYLTDLAAPQAKAGRPFADACRKHSLPEVGMTMNLSKVTTGTTTALQAAEADTVSETDIDDTLLPVSVQTNAGSQSISRQAIERGVGIEDTTLEDLFRTYNVTLDSTLINQATNGLTNIATAIAYTDASPTAAELYPKLLQAPAAVEAALLDMDPGDVIAVMHSRRWFWLQSQLSSTWPLFGQPGVAPQLSGQNFGERYGSGFRGVLPNGTPVIVDNNIATNLGTGTNEDEVYFVAQSEAHLWEDPNAPMLIKAEQNQAKKLLVDFVVYGYFAYTFNRRAHVQKINGTGLVTPTWA